MPEKLTVRTYRGDLPQLRVMLHCLNKYWQGNRFISIACTKNWDLPDLNIINDVRPIVEEMLTDGWIVEFVPRLQTNMVGYEEAQVYNFTMSMDDRFEESIGIDSKDFLLKPCDLNDFKVNGKYNIARFKDTRIFSEFYRIFCDRYGIDTLDIPLPIILTPYTFNTAQTKRIWKKLLDRYGYDFTTWTMFPTGVEWCVYYVETMLDPDPIVKFTDENSWMPIGGFYKNPNIAEGLEQERNFDLNNNTKFWKHHRQSNTKECVEITARVLKNHGIEDHVISRWKYEISNYILR
jgi:hypothetical protein